MTFEFMFLAIMERGNAAKRPLREAERAIANMVVEVEVKEEVGTVKLKALSARGVLQNIKRDYLSSSASAGTNHHRPGRRSHRRPPEVCGIFIAKV